jgi:hypothetical protein
MGFLDKLQHLAEGSGVRVQLQIMGPSDAGGQAMNVTVVLEAKSEPRQVSVVEVGISERENVDTNSQDPAQEESWTQMLWSTTLPVNASLQPGQPLSFPLQVPTLPALGSNTAFARMGQFFATSYGYYLQARATVEGSHLHPHAVQVLQGGGNWF